MDQLINCELNWLGDYLSSDLLKAGTNDLQFELFKEQIRVSARSFSNAQPIRVGRITSQSQQPLLTTHTDRHTSSHTHIIDTYIPQLMTTDVSDVRAVTKTNNFK